MLILDLRIGQAFCSAEDRDACGRGVGEGASDMGETKIYTFASATRGVELVECTSIEWTKFFCYCVRVCWIALRVEGTIPLPREFQVVARSRVGVIVPESSSKIARTHYPSIQVQR